MRNINAKINRQMQINFMVFSSKMESSVANFKNNNNPLRKKVKGDLQ